MKQRTRTLSAVCAALMLSVMFHPVTFAESAVSYTIRKEALRGETVSFELSYPRIYGMDDKNAQDKINIFLLEKARFLQRRLQSDAEKAGQAANGRLSAEVIHNSRGLLCTRFTAMIDGGGSELGNQKHFTLDLKTGKRLYFWDLFDEDGAKRQAAEKLLLDAIRQRTEPESEWVLKDLKNIGKREFFLGKDETLGVIFENGEAETFELSIDLAELEDLLKPSYVISS